MTVAAAVAIGVGEAISAARWYWAVLAAFVVFAGTVSVGETLNRAWGRTGGTVVGILAGIAVVRVVRGNDALELALIFAFCSRPCTSSASTTSGWSSASPARSR